MTFYKAALKKLAVASGAIAFCLAAAQTTASAQTIDMQAYVPQSLPVIGTSGTSMAKRVERLTGGRVKIVYNDPGALVPTNEILDAVSTGAVPAAWYTPGLAEGVIPAAPLFTAFPFGPNATEYTAWWYYGGGKDLWAELTAPFNVHTELCTILAPEASGWFAKPINRPDDLKGLRMRIFGLGAAVMEKLGVQAQSMGVGDTMTALNTGALDAAEISFPALDQKLGLQQHASHYYFPGWHQQSSFVTFMINKDVWNDLRDSDRAAIQETCAANVALSIAEGESIQLRPLAELKAGGVTVHKWNDRMLKAFRGGWDQVLAERTAADADFKRVWESITAFRADYATWGDLGYVK